MIAWVCLAIATLTVIYIVIGYPLLLAWCWKSEAPKIEKKFSRTPPVSVILAVHNGAAFIAAKLKTLRDLDYPQELVEIIVVSDGSTDETEALVQQRPEASVKLLAVSRRGKAAALNAALEIARGEILFFTDVRQPLDSKALKHLTANFADPTVGAVTGKLCLLKGEAGEQVDMDLYWRYELWARGRHSSIFSLFNTTGCIYAMRRDLVRPIPPDTLSDDAVLPLRAYFQGYRIIFDQEAIAYDYPAVAGTEFRRRFRTLAGLYQVHARLPQLFSRRNNPMRIHFLSHKTGRLVLPWAILGIYVATLLLPPSPWRTILLIGEATLIILAVADNFLSRDFRLKRLTSPPRTFFAMNLAAMAAILVFVLPATRLWMPTRVSSIPPQTQ